MNFDPDTEPIEILRMALEREKEAYAFYTEAAKAANHPATRATLLEMAEEEKRHIQQLEDELDRFYTADN